MWFGILTPGAHPSRRTPTDTATVFAWTPDDRRRIDGPLAVVHGGLRVVRRSFFDEGLVACPPRCFVCLAPCAVPDPAVVGEPEPSEPEDENGAIPRGEALPGVVDVNDAFLAYVWLDELTGPQDTPLDEEVLVALPEVELALLVPLERVPETLALVYAAGIALPRPRCTDCGSLLPGDKRTRDMFEAREARRAPVASRRGGHRRRAA